MLSITGSRILFQTTPSLTKTFRWTLGSAVIGIVGALALIFTTLAQEYQDCTEAATIQAENTSRLMAGYVLQTVQKIDMVLRDVQERVPPADMRAQRGQNPQRTEQLHRLLSRKLAAIPEANVLHLTNANGEHIYSSVPVVPNINIADRVHFQRQQARPGAGLVIAPPLISRTTGKWALILSRRLDFEDGSFAGIVSMVVNLIGIEKFFASIEVGRHGEVNLRDSEMSLMARHPPAEMAMGQSVPDHPALAFLRQGLDHAVYHAPISADGVPGLFSFRQVGDLGLYVFSGIAEEDYLADWRSHTATYGLVGVVLALTMCLMVLLARRNLIEQGRAVATLQREEEKFRTVSDYTFDWEYWQGSNQEVLYMSPSSERITGYTPAQFIADPDLLYRIIHPDDLHLMADHQHDLQYKDEAGVDFRIVRRDGEIRWIAHGCRPVFDRNNQFMGRRASNRDITERVQAEQQLKRIEWLLTTKDQSGEAPDAYMPPYGDLLRLNTSRLILDSVGEKVLTDLVASYLSLLDTSAAIYEKNGDYAVGIFSSGWCRFMDVASRAACGTNDNRDALTCGQWHCHESCWTNVSKVSIETGSPVDLECNGGIRLYAVPIRAGEEIVGSVNIGYGDPPRDEHKLQELAAKYRVTVEELRGYAESYPSRPPYIVEMAKRRLEATSRLLGEIIERKRIEAQLMQHRQHLEKLVAERTRELELRNHQLSNTQFAMDRAGIGIHWADADSGRLRYVNDHAARLLGYSREELLTMAIPDIDPNFTHENFRERTSHLRELGSATIESTQCKKDGTMIPVEVTFYYQQDAEQASGRFISFITDITERKLAQNALAQAKTAAEAANRAKSIFLANMSHELRTPLNAILGFSDILRRDPGLSEAQKENLAIVHKSGDHLLSLINDVLEITKIEAGRIVLEPAPFDLGGMIAGIAEMLRLRAQDKGLQLLVDQSSQVPRYIVGDEAKLRQILINLISNAIKATTQGGITLRLGVKRNRADHLLIEVEDTGIGISAEDQVKLFQPFVQVGAQGKQQGTGLGLVIARQFVELMGGSLSLTSTLGQGSIFRVEMPVQSARPEDVPLAPKARGEVTGLEPGQPSYRVLVCEDQLDNQTLLRRLLASAGFEVRVAGNGAEAVEQFTSWNPHFIWMDRRMPIMDGVAATRRIRALPDGKAVRIAAVTASSFKEDDADLTTAGFDAIVHKPFRAEQIFECMEGLAGLRFVRDEAEKEPQPLTKLSPMALAAVPVSLRQKLLDAAISLDGDAVAAICADLDAQQPEVAAAIRALANNYRYDELIRRLEE